MDSLYRIYLESNIALSRSVVFYASLAAEVANKEDRENGNEISSDRKQWRYFKHLNGDYHYLDPEIKITSLDTFTEIAYTKSELAKHKKTLTVYRNTPQYVRDLIAKYPNQSMLIRGVLNPIPYSTSLNAKEGDVLWLDESLIEPQEHYLRYEINSFIAKFIHRSFRAGYARVDDLYLQTQVAVLRLQLAKHIGSMRNSRIKTAEAHTYHITNYLASHNRLDQYLPYMTIEQKLFFYININWIERHIGHTETYEWLIEKLMTVRSLPMYNYRLVQQTPDLTTDTLQPTGIYARYPLNLVKEGLAHSVDTYPIQTVVYREAECATDNLANIPVYLDGIVTAANESQISSQPTCIVECAVIDPEVVSVVQKIDVVINHWLYLAATGKYDAISELLDPVSGDRLRLSPKELFLIYWYGMSIAIYGTATDKILPIGAQRINRLIPLTEDDYKAVIPWKECYTWRSELDVYQRTATPLEYKLTSNTEFADYCSEVTWAMDYRNQWTNGCQFGPLRDLRLALWQVSYVNSICDLKTDNYSTYAEFFNYLNIDYTLISNDGWMDLATAAFESATAWSNTNSISLEELQRQMISCFKRLSNYTLQFINDLIGEQTIITDNSQLTVQRATTAVAGSVYCPKPDIELYDFSASWTKSLDCNVSVGGLYAYHPHRVSVGCNVSLTGSASSGIKGSMVGWIPTLAAASDMEVAISKTPTLNDWIFDDTLDGFILKLDPVALAKCVTNEQLRGFFAKMEPVPTWHLVTPISSPSRRVIRELSELVYRS